MNNQHTGFGGAFVTATVRAELALAKGEIDEGLRLYRVAGKELDAIRLPGMEMTGLEPWSLFGDASGTTAFAVHGTGEDGSDLYLRLRAKARQVLNPDRPRMDYPVAGMVLHGLGTWGLPQAGHGSRGRHPPADPRRPVRLPEVHGDHGPDPDRRGSRTCRPRPRRPCPRRSTAPAAARPSSHRPRRSSPAWSPAHDADPPVLNGRVDVRRATSCGCRSGPTAARKTATTAAQPSSAQPTCGGDRAVVHQVAHRGSRCG